MDLDDLLVVIREFTGTILNPFDLPALLHDVTGHAMRVVGAAGAGIMLEDADGEPRFAAASDDRIVEIELVQERIEEGACYEAFSTNQVVAVADLAADDRWPTYRDRACHHGFASVVGVPLNAFGRTIGVINVYRSEPGAWTNEDLAAAEVHAAMAAGYIVNSLQVRAQSHLTDQLQQAIASRDLIGQAKGLLMARDGSDPDTAFEVLRQMSHHSNRKLREVAADIVSGHPRD